MFRRHRGYRRQFASDRGPGGIHYVVIFSGIMSHTFQNSVISGGMPSETLTHVSSGGNLRATSMPFFLKCSITSVVGRPAFNITKFACESIAGTLRALACWKN